MSPGSDAYESSAEQGFLSPQILHFHLAAAVSCKQLQVDTPADVLA